MPDPMLQVLVTGSSGLRGYPETLSSCHSDITQHSCGSETQGDRKEKAY
jgi:hypothetical protein